MKSHLAGVAEELAARDSALRPGAPDSLHLTLVFLGATPSDRAGAVWEVARASVAGIAAPELSPGAIVGIPRRRPRLLALELDDAEARAERMRDRIAGALASRELHEPESRPFWPHVTLARVRRGALPAAPRADAPPAPFAATALTLFSSRTHPAGARYSALERLPLGP